MRKSVSNALVLLVFFLGFTAAIDTMATEMVNAKAAASDGTSSIRSVILNEVALANVRKGNVAVGGDLGVSYSSYDGSSVFLNPSAEYFIADRFSVGGTLSFTFNSQYQSYGIGPSATYYFWNQGQWVASAGLGVRYAASRDDDAPYVREYSNWLGMAKLGLGFFATPAVSFGPQLTIYQDLASRYSDSGWGSLLFQFNVYL